MTLHQGFFAVWATATGLHLLGRIVPAVRLTLAPGSGAAAAPGAWTRWILLAAMAATAIALAVVLVHAEGSWAGFHRLDFHHDHGRSTQASDVRR